MIIALNKPKPNRTFMLNCLDFASLVQFNNLKYKRTNPASTAKSTILLMATITEMDL